MYGIGISGSGKSCWIKHLVTQDVLRGAAVVAIDPVGATLHGVVGALAQWNLSQMLREQGCPPALAAWRQAERDRFLGRVIVLDFETDFQWRWNPFELGQDGLSVEELASDFVRVFERVVGGEMAEMRQLLLNIMAIASVLIASGMGTVADIPSLCCADTETLEEFADRVERRRAAGRVRVPVRRSLLETYFRTFFSSTSHKERRDLIASTLRAVGIFLNDPIVARFLSAERSTLSLSQVTSEGRPLLVHIPPRSLHTQTILASMIVNRLQVLAERRSIAQVEQGQVPLVHCFIDEAQIVFTPELADFTARCRNKLFALHTFHQTSQQRPFQTPEGRALLQSVRDNSSTHLVLRVGQRDGEELSSFVFRPMGRSMVQRDYEQVSLSEGSSWSRCEARTVSRMITDAFSTGQSQAQSVSLGQNESVSVAESQGITQAVSRSLTLSRGKNWCRAVNRSTGVSVTVTDSRTIVEGHGSSRSFAHSRGHALSRGSSEHAGSFEGAGHTMSVPGSPMQYVPSSGLMNHNASSSTGLSHGSSASESESSSLAETVGHVLSKTASLSRGQSRGRARSRSTGVSLSQGGSESESRGRSVSQGLSRALALTQSLGRTLGEGRTDSTTSSSTRSRGRTQGEGLTNSVGGSQSRSRTRKVEVYSVSDEATVRGYELMSLPGREGYLVRSGPEGTRCDRMRTLDVPTRFHTAIGTLDGLADLMRLTAAPKPGQPPTSEIFERMRWQDRALGLLEDPGQEGEH